MPSKTQKREVESPALSRIDPAPLQELPGEPGAREEEAISTANPITSGLDQLLFPFPGAIRADESKGMNFERLVSDATLGTTVQKDPIRWFATCEDDFRIAAFTNLRDA